MRTNRVGVDAEERDGNERAVAAQAQDGVAELEGGVVFVGIALVEVDIFKKRWTSYLSNATFF